MMSKQIPVTMLDAGYYIAIFEGGERHQLTSCEIDEGEMFTLDEETSGWTGPSVIGGPSEYMIAGYISGVRTEAAYYNREAFLSEMAKFI